MGNYEYNNLEDLVFSRSFRNWVLKGDAPDAPEAGFWENWLDRHPERLELVQHAKAIIYALQLNLRSISNEETDTEIKKALYRLRDPQQLRPLTFKAAPPRSWAFSWGIGALVVGMCIAVWAIKIYSNRHAGDPLRIFQGGNHDKPVQQLTSDVDTGRVIFLPDGSVVRLQRGGKLYYPEGLLTANQRREVFLEGDAFFNIKYNGSHPFFVFTPTLLIKVLGTRFRVKGWPADPKTIVSVSAGKVSVYRKEEFPDAGGRQSAAVGVVVTPNQELVYDRDDNRLKKALRQQPELVNAKDSALVFEAAPVARIFRRLQEGYGIQIMYDEESVANCSLSAQLDVGSFYKKLDAVCRAINASWEAIDGNIVITAKGCR